MTTVDSWPKTMLFRTQRACYAKSKYSLIHYVLYYTYIMTYLCMKYCTAVRLHNCLSQASLYCKIKWAWTEIDDMYRGNRQWCPRKILLLIVWTMRILERAQAFLPLLTIEIFFIFPHSYVVSKLSYIHRALVSKCS